MSNGVSSKVVFFAQTEYITFDIFAKKIVLCKLDCGKSHMRTSHLIGANGLYPNLALLPDPCPYTLRLRFPKAETRQSSVTEKNLPVPCLNR